MDKIGPQLKVAHFTDHHGNYSVMLAAVRQERVSTEMKHLLVFTKIRCMIQVFNIIKKLSTKKVKNDTVSQHAYMHIYIAQINDVNLRDANAIKIL